MASVNLSSVNGLTTVVHQGESEISTRTIVSSQGKILDSFLKGCGLSDWEIESARFYDPDLSNSDRIDVAYRVAELGAASPIQPHPIFVSYSHADSVFVDKLQAALDLRGVRSWRDAHHATAGPLDRVIDRSIKLNPTMLLVLSEHSIESSWVKWEVEKAIEHERKHGSPVLCPIAIDESWREKIEQLPGGLLDYTILDFSKEEEFQERMPLLLKGLQIFYRKESGPAKPRKAKGDFAVRHPDLNARLANEISSRVARWAQSSSKVGTR